MALPLIAGIGAVLVAAVAGLRIRKAHLATAAKEKAAGQEAAKNIAPRLPPTPAQVAAVSPAQVAAAASAAGMTVQQLQAATAGIGGPQVLIADAKTAGDNVADAIIAAAQGAAPAQAAALVTSPTADPNSDSSGN